MLEECVGISFEHHQFPPVRSGRSCGVRFPLHPPLPAVVRSAGVQLGPDFRSVCRLSQQFVARAFQIEITELRRPSRRGADIARARQAAMYLANVAGGIAFSDVARGFGRDRSTVSYACGVIEDLRDDADLDIALDLLGDALRALCRMPSLR